MAGWHHRLDGHEFEWTPGVGDGQGGLACCDSWGCKELDTTERLNWTELIIKLDLNGRSLFVSIGPRWTLKPVSVTYSNSIASKLSGMSFIFCSASIMRKYPQFCFVLFFFLMMARLRLPGSPFLETLSFHMLFAIYCRPKPDFFFFFFLISDLPFLFSSKCCSQRKWLWLAGLFLSLWKFWVGWFLWPQHLKLFSFTQH